MTTTLTVKEMTKTELISHAKDLFAAIDENYGERLGYLRCRWEDEKGYEDWNEYEKVIRDWLKNYNIIKVLKVGVVLHTEYFDISIKYNLTSVKWKIIKLNNARLVK